MCCSILKYTVNLHLERMTMHLGQQLTHPILERRHLTNLLSSYRAFHRLNIKSNEAEKRLYITRCHSISKLLFLKKNSELIFSQCDDSV